MATREALEIAVAHLRGGGAAHREAAARLQQLLAQRGCRWIDPYSDALPEVIDALIDG